MPRSVRYGVIAPHGDAAAVRAAGADYVEPTVVGNLLVAGDGGTWTPHPTLGEWERSPSFAVLCPPELRLSDPSSPAADVETYLRTAFETVRQVATDDALVVLGSGASRRIPDGVDQAAGRETFARSLHLAHEIAGDQGLEVVLEPLHRGETDLINSIGEAVEFLDTHDLVDVRVVADLFHIMLEDEPLDAVRAHAGRIGHAHIADAGRRPPGQGDWPLAEFLSALRDGAYGGNVTIECTWADIGAEAADALEVVRRADAG